MFPLVFQRWTLKYFVTGGSDYYYYFASLHQGIISIKFAGAIVVVIVW